MARRPLPVALLALALVTAGLVAVLAARLLSAPPAAGLPAPGPGAGARFQGALAQLLLRQAGLSSGRDPLVVTADEVNGFLSTHFQAHHLGVDRVAVRLAAGRLEIAARSSLGRLATRAGVPAAGLVPDAALAVPVWLVLEGRIRLEGGRAAVEVDRLWIGRQRVPPWLFWRVLGTSPSEALSWRAPRVLERIDIEPGRLVAHTRPGRR